MSAAQHQALVLGGVSFVAFIVFLCFLVPSRRTRFSVFAACNLLFVALMFGAVGLIDLAGGRAEIMVAVMTELPVVLIVAWVCLALGGGLPSRHGTLPAEPVVRRPWLRAMLGSAPLVLLLSLGLATVVGLVWPSPAMRVYAPAPPQFFVLKGLIMVPEGLYSSVAAVVFVMAGRAPGLKRRFYFKNLAFSVGMVCIAAIALESTVFAGLRVWFSGGDRRALLEVLNTVEACLAISCILAFTAGLSLRYTPAVATTLLHRLQTGWLHAQEQFESLEWQAVSSGAADRLMHTSNAVVEACRIRDLSQSDTQKALATIRLVAVMRDPSSEAQHITPDAARKLYELQQEILCDDVLASKISWAAGWRARAHEPQTVKSAPLHDALKAALDLVDNHGESEGPRTPPLWYYIVAASAADAKPTVEKRPGHIELARWSEMFVVLPATANVIGQAANGLGSNLLTTTILASPRPVIFYPNVNDVMWSKAAVQRNVETLRGDGHIVIEPEVAIAYEVDSGETRESLVVPEPTQLVEQLQEIHRQSASLPIPGC